MSLQNDRDRFALYGCGAAIALFGHSAQQFGRQAERIKRYIGIVPVSRPDGLAAVAVQAVYVWLIGVNRKGNREEGADRVHLTARHSTGGVRL